jgi:hypothetical protein
MLCQMDPQALIFLHIPKTARTTPKLIIEWEYSPFSFFTLDPCPIRATAERFKTLSEQRRRRLEVVRESLFFILRRPLHLLHRKLKKERLGVEDYLRTIFHRQRFPCRLVTGIEGTAVGDERLPETAKVTGSRAPF